MNQDGMSREDSAREAPLVVEQREAPGDDGSWQQGVGAVVRALPDVARIVAGGLWRTNRWALETTARVGGIVLRGAISGQPTNVLADRAATEVRDNLRALLGVTDLPDPLTRAWRGRVVDGDGDRAARSGSGSGSGNGTVPAARDTTVPQRMAALLDASADMEHTEDAHPAYVRVLGELAPDEARILRLFARQGPQASVDVRTRSLFGVGSRLIAPGLTMIGRHAGCRDLDRVPAYLNNLFRLGLIWFSRESLPEQSVYDVLEVQEEVLDALEEAGRGVTVRRSIELTAFGTNLCAMAGLTAIDKR